MFTFVLLFLDHVCSEGVREVWPRMTLSESAKHLKSEARKEGSCSEAM